MQTTMRRPFRNARAPRFANRAGAASAMAGAAAAIAAHS